MMFGILIILLYVFRGEQESDNYISSSHKSAAPTVHPMSSIVRYLFDGSYSYTIYHGYYRL